MNELLNFYDSHHGTFDTFLFSYDGGSERVRFSNSLSVKGYRENDTIVAYSSEVSLTVVRNQKTYKSNNDVLFSPSEAKNRTSSTHEWLVGKVELGQTSDFYLKSPTPTRTISGTWSGNKKSRDKLLGLFYSYSRNPISFSYAGEKLKVRLPDSLEITDYREIKNIVGFECNMDLEVIP